MIHLKSLSDGTVHNCDNSEINLLNNSESCREGNFCDSSTDTRYKIQDAIC